MVRTFQIKKIVYRPKSILNKMLYSVKWKFKMNAASKIASVGSWKPFFSLPRIPMKSMSRRKGFPPRRIPSYYFTHKHDSMSLGKCCHVYEKIYWANDEDIKCSTPLCVMFFSRSSSARELLVLKRKHNDVTISK